MSKVVTNPAYYITSASTVNAAGTGYVVGNTLTLIGGTFTTAAQIQVLTVTSGGIATFSVTVPGNYSVLPANPVSLSGGAGTGGQLTAYWLSASPGYTNIELYGTNTAGTLPPAGSLNNLELFVDTATPNLFVGNAVGTRVKLVGTLGGQDANAVNITGGNIISTTLSNNAIIGGSINSTPIGNTTPVSGSFSTLTVPSFTSAGVVVNTPTGQLGSTSTLSGIAINSVTIDNAPVGNSIPSTGKFTSLDIPSFTTAGLLANSATGNFFSTVTPSGLTSITLTQDPTLSLQVATKNYVDTTNTSLGTTPATQVMGAITLAGSGVTQSGNTFTFVGGGTSGTLAEASDVLISEPSYVDTLLVIASFTGTDITTTNPVGAALAIGDYIRGNTTANKPLIRVDAVSGSTITVSTTTGYSFTNGGAIYKASSTALDGKALVFNLASNAWVAGTGGGGGGGTVTNFSLGAPLSTALTVATPSTTPILSISGTPPATSALLGNGTWGIPALNYDTGIPTFTSTGVTTTSAGVTGNTTFTATGDQTTVFTVNSVITFQNTRYGGATYTVSSAAFAAGTTTVTFTPILAAADAFLSGATVYKYAGGPLVQTPFTDIAFTGDVTANVLNGVLTVNSTPPTSVVYDQNAPSFLPTGYTTAAALTTGNTSVTVNYSAIAYQSTLFVIGDVVTFQNSRVAGQLYTLSNVTNPTTTSQVLTFTPALLAADAVGSSARVYKVTGSGPVTQSPLTEIAINNELTATFNTNSGNGQLVLGVGQFLYNKFITYGSHIQGSIAQNLMYGNSEIYISPTVSAGSISVSCSQTTLISGTINGASTLTITAVPPRVGGILSVVTITYLASQTATTNYINALAVTGFTLNPIRWQGGSAPTAGSSTGFDLYQFSLFGVFGAYDVIASRISY